VSRRSNRNRHRAVAAKAAPRNPGGVTLSGDQLTAVLAASQQAAQLATPLPRPPQWATDPFGPGQPLRPSPINARRPQTGRAEPRLFELPISTNLNVGTAPFVPWRVLSDAADMPLFRKCIQRRKSICELGFTVSVDPKAVAREAAVTGQATKDIESALRSKYMPEISRISDWMETPDRKNGYDWEQWSSQLMENRLVYDATVVYPRQTYGGQLFALEVIDGSTIKPLLDEYGGRPMPDAPFAQQVLYGFPRGEFAADVAFDENGNTVVPGGLTSDQLLYERTIIRPKTPYGMSATEIALLDGILWMRRMGWLLAEYDEGVTGAMLEVGAEVEWTIQQWLDYSRALNDRLSGNTAERMRYSMLPPGTKAVLPEEIAERYKPDMDLFLVKLIAGDYGLPASEVGFTETGALGASFHEGEEDIFYRQTRLPDSNWLGKIATRLAVRQLRMPPVLRVQVLGMESEDEAAADSVAASQVNGARSTLNEDRARRGLPPYPFPEADKPMLITPRGVVFIEGAAQAAPAGTLIGPAQAPPQGAPQQGGQQDEGDGQDDEQDGPPAASKSAELAALRKWLGRHPSPSRPFACKALTAADVPAELAADPRVALKASDAGPKGTGPDGTATWP
jgi:hypothetical protein